MGQPGLGRASGPEAGSGDRTLPAVSSSLVRARWPGPPLLCSHWGPCWPGDPTPHGQGAGLPSVSRLWNEPWGGRCSRTWVSHLAAAGPLQEGDGHLAGLGWGAGAGDPLPPALGPGRVAAVPGEGCSLPVTRLWGAVEARAGRAGGRRHPGPLGLWPRAPGRRPPDAAASPLAGSGGASRRRCSGRASS